MAHLSSIEVLVASLVRKTSLIRYETLQSDNLIKDGIEGRLKNDPEPCVGDGVLRHLRPETGRGAGPERPLPGVSGLLPGGHPAAHGRAERSLSLHQSDIK